MNRKKLLIENIIVYGLGGVLTKIIPFIMLPIITDMMPDTSCFGVYDLYSTVTSLCTTVGMLGMSDAAFRFFFDSEEVKRRKEICATAWAISTIVTVGTLVILAMFGELISLKIYGAVDYLYLIAFNIVAVFIGNLSTLIALPTRMQNNRKVYLITNTLSSILFYLLAMILLYRKHYILALPLASVLTSSVMLIIYFVLNGKWYSIKFINYSLSKELIKYGLPIMPQHLMYYVMNTSDKWMIALFLGQAYNGVYALGGKFGQASQLIYVAFAGGWLYYRYKTMNADDQVENVSRVFEFLGYASFAALLVCCAFARFVIVSFFDEAYQEAYVLMPYLFFAPLIQMLFQVIAGQFAIIKKTWVSLICLLAGAFSNVLLNYLLIPFMGLEGAAIATLAGYSITLVICSVIALGMERIKISGKFYGELMITIACFAIWRSNLETPSIYLISALIGILLITFLYRNEIIRLFRKGN